MRKPLLILAALVPLAMLAALTFVVWGDRGHRAVHPAIRTKPLKPVTKQRLAADDLYAKRDLKAARKAYEAIIAKNAGSKDPKVQDEVASSRMRLGYVVAKTDGYAKAREVFLQAAKSYKGSGAMDPEFGRPDDQAAYQAAVCLAAEGKKAEARRELRQIVRERTKSPVIYLAFRRMQRLGDPNKAEEAEMQASIYKQEAWMKFETSVCGPKAIAYLLDLLGMPAKDYHEIAKMCGTNEHGTSLLAMRDTLRKLGLESEGLLLNRRDFAKVATPAIWLQQDHYVVLLRIDGDEALVYDSRLSDRRTVKLPPEDDATFTATVLTVRRPAAKTARTWAQPSPLARGAFDGEASKGVWSVLDCADQNRRSAAHDVGRRAYGVSGALLDCALLDCADQNRRPTAACGLRLAVGRVSDRASSDAPGAGALTGSAAVSAARFSWPIWRSALHAPPARARGDVPRSYRRPLSRNSDYRIFNVAFTDETSVPHGAAAGGCRLSVVGCWLVADRSISPAHPSPFTRRRRRLHPSPGAEGAFTPYVLRLAAGAFTPYVLRRGAAAQRRGAAANALPFEGRHPC
jgi:tetratricopeptide (TPR) repeat protein